MNDISDFIKKYPEELKFFKRIKQIVQMKNNPIAIKRLIDTKEDIEYLFKINDRKTYLKARESLRILYRKAGSYEKQFISFLLNKNVVFESALVGIACHSLFNNFVGKHRRQLHTFKFKRQEEKVIFQIYWTMKVQRKSILECEFNLDRLNLRQILILLYFTGSETILRNIIDRFSENMEILRLVLKNFELSYVFLSMRIADLSRKDKLLIAQMDIDIKKLTKLSFFEAVFKFNEFKNEEIYTENMLFNEISIKENCTNETLNDSTNRVDIFDRKSTLSDGLQKNSRIEQFTSKNQNSPKTSQVYTSKTSKPAISIRKLQFSWLRVFLMANNHILFLKVFNSLKPDSSAEYQILNSIKKKVMDTILLGTNQFSSLEFKIQETNEYATVKISTLLRHLKENF